jgi:hypothetical protein
MKLTTEQITSFQKLVETITSVKNHDEYVEMLNDLYYSVNSEKFETFAQIINDANDSEFRCPK